MPSKRSVLSLACCLVLLAVAPQQQDRPPLYDPARDPFEDLQDTIVVAQESGKHILLNVGGNWCGWCYTLDAFIKANDDVGALLEAGFVVVKINMSTENRNEKFLSQYPEVYAYPYFFVLDGEGTFLHAQRTGPLEDGASYDKGKLMAFFGEWGPHPRIP